MEFLGNNKGSKPSSGNAVSLYRALAVGDLPAAWLLTGPFLEQGKKEKLSASTSFNCGLCLYQLEEYEKALNVLKQAEQLLNTPPDFDMQEKKLFFHAIENGRQTAFLPLEPESEKGLDRYVLIRVRWLAALCLTALERRQEAAPMIRFLNQYHIEL